MIMKKFFSLIIACLSLALVLSACSKDSGPDKDLNPDPTPTPTPTPVDTGLIVKVGEVEFKMIKVEKGTFQMGVKNVAEPVHQVTFTKDFYMGETEVTQALWKAVMDSNPSTFTTSDQLPVENVSYDDIVGENGFLAKLNAATGKTFRLPTEAEWEFAFRGGNESKGYEYSGSNNVDEVAWYSDNCDSKTHEVATKKANELGLYDMSGNVWEWCSDWYGDYSSEAQTDPVGPTTGSYRVRRGGSFSYDLWRCRFWFRSCDASGSRGDGRGHGLRLALSE